MDAFECWKSLALTIPKKYFQSLLNLYLVESGEEG